MDDLTPERLAHNSYTVGWICALDVELAASVAILDYELPKLSQVQGDTNTYVLGRIGQHNIVLTCLPAGTTGTNAAANTATNMLRSFPNIHFCLMVGIGGGAPSVPSDDPRKDIRLGDVVVSWPSANFGGVLQYDFGKTMSEGKFVHTGVLNKTSIVLRSSVSALRARHRIEESRVPQYIVRMLELNRKMQREFSHPGLEHDQLFRADYEHPSGKPTCLSCDIEALVLRKPRENTNPIIHYGLIGSANQVMRHGVTRDQLRDEKNIICFEMEAAGLMDVFPCLVIRGICDYADSHKNKRWQPYAAVTAAACAKEVLLATPTSEFPIKTFLNEEAIYRMLQTTLSESNGEELLKLLPISEYRPTLPEYHEIPKNNDSPEFHWVLRNIDFKQWSLNEGPRLLCLTGHPSQNNLNQLSSYIVDQEKAANYSILSISRSDMEHTPTINALPYILLRKLVCCSPNSQKTHVIRSFFKKLLENHKVESSVDWKEATFNNEIFLKYMEKILKGATTKDLLSPLKTAVDFAEQRRLLVVIEGLDLIEPMDDIVQRLDLVESMDDFVHSLIKHLQRKSKIKILITSSARFKNLSLFQDFLNIEYDKERKDCLRSLQFDNARYDKISNECERSFEWIWKHNEYKTWSASNTSKLFYIQGKPGSGKSTLMKYFNRNLQHKDSAAQQGIVARFFYSSRDGEPQRSHYNMLLSILYEILHQDEGFFYHQFQTEYRTQQLEKLPSTWDYDSLKEMLKSLQDYRTNKRYYLIIDAIDESEPNDRREILGLLFDLCSKMKHSVVKIFIASRPVAQLESRRDQFHSFIKLDAETRSDIYNYAQSQLHGLNSTELLTQATTHILENAQGVFLWVKLISEQLIKAHEEGLSEEEIFRLLKQLPTELEDLYKLMLEKMEHNNASLLYGARMFEFILFARRPLTVDELLHALGILNTADSDSKLIPSDALFEKHIPTSDRIILSGGGNFLELREHNGKRFVQIMHQTVREFFLSPDGPVANSKFSVSETYGHIHMAISCMRYLSVCAANTCLAKELPEFKSWDILQYKDYCQYLNRRPLASYALSYTKSHIAICERDANVQKAVSQFIEQSTKVDHSASLLERWASSELRQGPLSNNNTQDAAAMNFRCELLRVASIYGFSTAAEVVLLAETDIDNRDKDDRTPLFLAVDNGHEAIAKLLLDKGADVHIKDNHDQTPLTRAVVKGHQNIVTWLFGRGASIEEGYYDRTPLSWAAENGYLAIVEFLIEKGAYIGHADHRGRTPLFWAAECGHLAIVERLLEKGADIEKSASPNGTPLLQAVKQGHLAIVELLAEKGADIKSDTFSGTTVEFLAKKGASTEKEDISGKSPLLVAVEHGHLAIVKFLVEKGSSIEYSGRFWSTPLSRAAQYGYLAIVEFLVEKGANIHRLDLNFKTPLSLAAEYGHLAVVIFLAGKGANFERPDISHKTPLSLAVEKGHFEVVKFLAGKGANTESKDRYGKTPVSKAVENSRLDIVKFLVEMC
ncbi:uncharacterized protein TrAtP1_011676 [Trichoderma atroviride]|nr:hypothetical protein TrAtP1_011676 [Trichoderma atroviride]